MKTFDPIYKRDSKGKTRIWFVQLDVDGDAASYQQVSGLANGAQTEQGWKDAAPKNVGKANETTAAEQAELEIDALYTKKLKSGYFRNIDEIGSFDKFKPMLARDYDDLAPKMDLADGYHSQPKLDGLRCGARADGMWSRQFEEFTTVSHIHEAAKPILARADGFVLDGELYNHYYKDRFNELSGIIRREKGVTVEVQEDLEALIELHVYDCFHPDYPNASFEERQEILREIFETIGDDTPLKYVPTEFVTSQDKLDALYDSYLDDGYEGQMVRSNGAYEQGRRSKQVLKRKVFETAEFRVKAVHEGQGGWKGHVKKFECYLDGDGGDTFGAGPNGSKPQMKELFESGQTPDWATVQYQPVKTGKPRIARVKDYGWGERRD